MMRALDDASMLDRYIEIKTKISELQEELEELKAPLMYALMEEPDEKNEYKGFEFSIQRRKTYAYSTGVQDLEETLKKAREAERHNGIAEIVKDQAILVLRSPKSG
jgi:hypothetical protein